MTIFFQDLKEDVQQEIIEELKERLNPEILEAVEAGIDRETAEVEIVDDYLNTNNFGIELDY